MKNVDGDNMMPSTTLSPSCAAYQLTAADPSLTTDENVTEYREVLF